jgi:hypothetical protein
MNPTSIDQDAPVVSLHSLLIEAPLPVVWALHTDIDNWPTWQHAITRVDLDGTFTPGGTFAWSTYGLDVTSTIYDVEPMVRTLWGGPSGGIVGIHQWTFSPQSSGVLVATEESWSGAPVEAGVTELQRALDASLVGWLEALAEAARQAASIHA